MSWNPDRYLPLEPLIEFIGDRATTVQDRADLCGTTQRNFYRWKRDGQLMHAAADKAAVALGVHPSAIWGREFDEAFQ